MGAEYLKVLPKGWPACYITLHSNALFYATTQMIVMHPGYAWAVRINDKAQGEVLT